MRREINSTHEASPMVKLLLGIALCCPPGMALTTVWAEPVDTVASEDITPANRMEGRITEVINASGYTYVEIASGNQKVWAAGPVTPFAIGDTVAFLTEMPMENFHSKALQRDFPLIYFVGQFITDKTAPALTTELATTSHESVEPAAEPAPVTDVAKLEGGLTIAEIQTRKAELAGQTIRLRGKVSKFTAEVMGKNWVHLRDGSTLEDLTVTTNDTTELESIIIIEGKLALDKDFGYGYKYPVILEDASISQK